MSEETHRRRHRSPSPQQKSTSADPDNPGHRHARHKQRQETDFNSDEATLTKILKSVDDMNKQFVTWTNRVTDIETKINENTGETFVHSEEVDDVDQLSIRPNECNVFTTNKLATEAPLAGVCPYILSRQ